jgi:hypothetical protein
LTLSLRLGGNGSSTGITQPCKPCHLMKPTPRVSKPFPRLADIEQEVVAEAREWGRQRLQERLQKLAEESGEVFPPPATPAKAAQPAKRTGRAKAAG